MSVELLNSISIIILAVTVSALALTLLGHIRSHY